MEEQNILADVEAGKGDILSEVELSQQGINQISSPPELGISQPDQPTDVNHSNPLNTEIEGEEEGVNPLQEVASAVGGGAVDAIESAGGFAELTGDTIKTGLNALLGKNDEEQNPFSEQYIHGDGNWLNVPDQITGPSGNVIWEDSQPRTAIGKFGRGLVEFGLLSWATAGVGGAALGGARVGVRGIAAARSMGVGAQGSRYLKLITKGAKIGSEGAIADLISSSSEHANIMNLAQENIPWAVPIIGDMIAVKPEDNPWTARFKSVAAGAGLNYVGHAIGAIYKGFWEAGRARINGKSVDEANIIGNEAAANDFTVNTAKDEDGITAMALDDYQQGRGISRAEPFDEYSRTYLSPEEYDEWATKRSSTLDEDAVRTNELEAQAQARGEEAGDIWDEELQTNTLRDIEDSNRQPSPFVNDNQFTQTEKATYSKPDNATRKHLSETIESRKLGGESVSDTTLISENDIKAVIRGDTHTRNFDKALADEITEAAFKSVDNRLPWKEVRRTILIQANDILDILEGGGDLGKAFKDSLEDPNNKAFRLYSDGPGNQVITISPTQKAANVLVMKSLARKIQTTAQAAVAIADDVPIGRQSDMMIDQLQVLLKENKKMGIMWGLDGKAQQQYTLSPTLERMKRQSLEVIDQELDEYTGELRKLIKDERWQELEDLAELHELSGGKVRTIHHINEYLRSILRGGRMDDVHIKGRVRKELQGTFFNSVLSSFATPIKAIAGTNMLVGLRPLQAWMGAGLRGNRKEMFMAASQMDNMGKAWAESLQMAQHNWDLGVKRKGQTYQGKFDYDADLQEWKGLKQYYERYGSAAEKNAYGALDVIVNINSSPWVKYSINAMGAGDAAARTMIGRQTMRMRAASKAWDDAIKDGTWTDGKTLKKIAADAEEGFRNEIFKQDKDGMWVVSDKGASMAGDEAAMSRGLQENFKGFELISNIPGMKAFFPFVRTGFNYLDVTFQHTPLAAFTDKYHDIKKLASDPNPSKRLLNKYGIRPDDLQYELAVMEGRMAMGTSVIGLATLAALQGRITGNYPVNKEDADLWRLNGIPPKSFKLNDGTYVSYDKLEIFNTIFSATANVVGHSDLLGEEVTDEWMKKLVYMTSAVLVDQSMLGGVEDLARLMNPQTAEDLLLRSGTRYLRSHLPYAGLSGQISDVLDANEREANTFWEMLGQRDIIARQHLPVKYDVLNKERVAKPLRFGPEQPLWRLANSNSLAAVTQIEGDELKEALHAIRFNMPETLSTYRGEPLSSQEKSAFEEYLSTSDLRKDLLRVIRHPAFKKSLEKYQKLNLKESDGYKVGDQIFYQAIQKVFSRHKSAAMRHLIAQNGPLATRLLEREAKKEVGRKGLYLNEEFTSYLINDFPK